jgi:hypothetical protein
LRALPREVVFCIITAVAERSRWAIRNSRHCNNSSVGTAKEVTGRRVPRVFSQGVRKEVRMPNVYSRPIHVLHSIACFDERYNNSVS